MTQNTQNDTFEGIDVVLVGHCGPDQHMLKSTVERALPGASVASVNDMQALEPYLRPGAVLLINRVLDGQFDAAGGIDLIDRIHTAHREGGPALLLVSDLPVAQEQALYFGALPGFGKRELYDKHVVKCLRDAAAAATTPA